MVEDEASTSGLRSFPHGKTRTRDKRHKLMTVDTDDDGGDDDDTR